MDEVKKIEFYLMTGRCKNNQCRWDIYYKDYHII